MSGRTALQLLSSTRRIRDLTEPPSFACQAMPNNDAGSDKRMLDYLAASRAPFEDLRQVVTQIAALLILAASGSRDWRDHPMIDVTIEAWRGVDDAIRAIAVPDSAAHVHGHFVKAGRSVTEAIGIIAARRPTFDDAALDAALAALKTAQQEMQWSSAAVPGLEVVDFSQGCCAMHTNLKSEI